MMLLISPAGISVGANKVLPTTSDSNVRLAPRIITAAAGGGRISCPAKVTNNNTAATLECTSHAKAAPIANAINKLVGAGILRTG